MARATTSLPTPLSPVISTLASERATRSISAFNSEITALVPIICTCPFCLISAFSGQPLKHVELLFPTAEMQVSVAR